MAVRSRRPLVQRSGQRVAEEAPPIRCGANDSAHRPGIARRAAADGGTTFAFSTSSPARRLVDVAWILHARRADRVGPPVGPELRFVWLRWLLRGSARQSARHFQSPSGSEPKVVREGVAAMRRGSLGHGRLFSFRSITSARIARSSGLRRGNRCSGSPRCGFRPS